MRISIGLFAILAVMSSTALSAADRFELSSSSFEDGGYLNRRFAGVKAIPYCVGDNISPAFSWKHEPLGTRSFAMLLVSPEGREGLGVDYWVAYGIPAQYKDFAEGEFDAPSAKFVAGIGSEGTRTYLGPCPPVGGGYHYHFMVIATDLAPDALPPGLTKAQLLEKLKGHAKGSAGLITRFVHP